MKNHDWSNVVESPKLLVMEKSLKAQVRSGRLILDAPVDLPDGRVEIVATGAVDQVDTLITWTHKGSSASRVTGVDVQELGIISDFESFKIIR